MNRIAEYFSLIFIQERKREEVESKVSKYKQSNIYDHEEYPSRSSIDLLRNT